MRTITYTLDPDFLISAARSPREAEFLRALGQSHAEGKADIAVVALSPVDERGAVSASLEDALGALGLGGVRLILPMCDNEPDIVGECAGRNDGAVRLQLAIHNILFPNRAFDLDEARRKHGVVDAENVKFRRKWREARRNVQSTWSHIVNKRDVLITDNQNFFKRTKRPMLSEIGVRELQRLEVAAASVMAADRQT